MIAKFDPVAFFDEYFSDHEIEDAIRALAAEAAKQQARRDAEICRGGKFSGFEATVTEAQYHNAASELCAQAIEREAGL